MIEAKSPPHTTDSPGGCQQRFVRARLGPSCALRNPADLLTFLEAESCACGHAALAAAMGRDVAGVLRPFLESAHGLWVNEPQMKAAIESLGWGWRQLSLSTIWPSRMSLVLIQGLGSWMNPGVPWGARNARTHWVASTNTTDAGAWVYDINCGEWVPHAEWQSRALPEILRSWKAEKWDFRAGLGLCPHNQFKRR